MYVMTREQFNCSIFIPTPVLGRNEKLISCHIKHLSEKWNMGNVHGGEKKVFVNPFFIYIFEPLYYQMCLLNVIVLFLYCV